jgi:hypothetical protein
MTCSTSAVNGSTRWWGAPAHHPAAVDVVGGEVGQRAASAVLELLPPDPARCQWQVRGATSQRLELRLLIGANHVLVVAQRLAVPQPVVQVQHPTGLDREVRVTREDPRPVLPRLDHVLTQPPPHGGGRDRLHHSACDRSGGQLSAAPPEPAALRSRPAVQAIALTSAAATAGKVRGRPLRGRSSSPASRSAANRPRHLRTVSTVTTRRSAITALLSPVRRPARSRPAAHHAAHRGSGGPGRQELPLSTAQHDPNRAAHRHDPVVPVPWPGATSGRCPVT